jgi:hypothetical protein
MLQCWENSNCCKKKSSNGGLSESDKEGRRVHPHGRRSGHLLISPTRLAVDTHKHARVNVNHSWLCESACSQVRPLHKNICQCCMSIAHCMAAHGEVRPVQGRGALSAQRGCLRRSCLDERVMGTRSEAWLCFLNLVHAFSFKPFTLLQFVRPQNMSAVRVYVRRCPLVAPVPGTRCRREMPRQVHLDRDAVWRGCTRAAACRERRGQRWSAPRKVDSVNGAANG